MNEVPPAASSAPPSESPSESPWGTGATDTTRPAAAFGYQPALDGLRAVAVGSVIAFHFGAVSMPGGFLGVDTFFVLSGFLITSLLLLEWRSTGGLRFAAFWIRRARRLLPALLLVLLAIALWAYFESATNQLDGIRSDSLWTLFYGANWRFISSGQSYFDLFAGQASPLRHAWSLAIEEQFYLVWPLILYACLRLGRGRTRLLTILCVVGTIASGVLCWSLYNNADPSRAYYGTDTRASQLLIGALLAIVLSRWAPRATGSRRLVQLAGFVGAVFCVWAFASAHDRDTWLYRGGFVLFAIATALVIAAVVQPTTTPLRAVLSMRAVRWVGQISYGLYLWHWPVQVAVSEGRSGLDGWELAVVRLALTFGIATASYYLVELPIRHGGLRGWAGRLSAPIGVAAVAMVVVVATAGATAAPSFVSVEPGKVVRGSTTDVSSRRSGTTTTTVVTGIPTPPTPPTPPVSPGKIFVIGDSVLQSLTPELLSAAAARGLTLETASKPGCGILGGRALRPEDGTEYPWSAACEQSSQVFKDSVGADTTVKVIVWIDLWDRFDRIVDGVRLDLDTPAGATQMLKLLEQTRAALTASGARLVLVAMPPNTGTTDFPFTVEENHHVEVINRLLRAVAALRPESTSLVDLTDIVCPVGAPCPEMVGGAVLRPEDGRHYSPEGAAYVAPRMLELILGQLRKAEGSG